jgi:hypothetical protein
MLTLAAPTTVLLAEALWAPVGSAVVWVSVAVLVIVPAALSDTSTVIVAVAVAPFASAPTVQVTVPLVPTVGLLKLPVAEDEETKVVPAGNGSLTDTPEAASGPTFDNPIVYVICVPCAVLVDGLAIFVIDTLAAATTVLVADAV